LPPHHLPEACAPGKSLLWITTSSPHFSIVIIRKRKAPISTMGSVRGTLKTILMRSVRRPSRDYLQKVCSCVDGSPHLPHSDRKKSAALNVYHTMLRDEPQWYSDPRNFGSIVFPFLNGVQPDKFSLQNDKFEYLDREIFRDAYEGFPR
jgi:hypothetical protein